LAQRTQPVVHKLAERIQQCGQLANELSDVIDDLACAPHLAVEVEAVDGRWTLSGADVRSLMEGMLIARAEIRRRITSGGFWTDQAEQTALLRWLVKTLLASEAGKAEPAC